MSATHKAELLQLRHLETFRPFRLYTTKGEVFTVLDHVTFLPAGWDVVLPAGVTPDNIYGEYPVPVPYEKIARIEFLEAAPASGEKA